ncbi:MAG: Asp-tRNA(Asn)/Glu-tRNA(Gln) amidotransferase subunit GatA [Alphaproteobacteria bacterium]|nr:Asp-tRNA(Asn)/Glu-tRNA(Gln) amidotransferase subunit GatA [Alphaproteobacteria bacterium]MCB9985018.1 Asp-tRNA(Asn)/Glu-tRNA(Gln) amidotransferase subunit GatA [Micavibrio sp.]HRK97408.1 Asp-tRNA(Asn)/Glu-tRNA(Gln) amidotransferase subunit GatA [Alphaproteobacteria bacterium]
MTSKLISLTITQALTGLKNKDFSATELVKDHIAQMESCRNLNAMITELPEQALASAAQSDARIAKGEMRPLEGIPIAMKDLFCTKDIRTTAASHILGNFIPPYESTVSQKLIDAGTISVGKTNLDEFAMGGSNTTSYYGAVESPWKSKTHPDKKLVPGGSSGGSAAAVSSGMAMAATGTDTGGSTRQPASFCGIVGVKPTYGRCSRWGIIAFASSLDQAGAFARNVEDSALMIKAMAGHDAKDSTSANKDVPNFSALMKQDIKGLRIGIPKEYRVDGMPQDIIDIWEKGAAMLKAAGAEIIDISLPHTKYAVPTYYIVAPAEASSNLARYDGVRYGLRVEGKDLQDMYEQTRAEGFGAEVKRRIMIGTYCLSAGYYDAYYTKAQKIRRLISNDFAAAFEKCDAILTPTAPSSAFAIGENSDDPIKMYLGDVFTIPASLAGLPGISVPAALDDQGLPLGLQIIGRAWDEATMFRTAFALEQAIAFSAQPDLMKSAA